MSDTTLLKDVLKGAPAVTSFASSDRLMAVGSDGSPKRIDRASLLATHVNLTLKEAGWFRVLSYNVAGDAVLSISNGWGALKGNHVLFAVMMHASIQYNRMQVLSNMSNDGGVPSFAKVRVVRKDASAGWLDVYYPGSGNFQTVGLDVLAMRNCTLCGAGETADIPQGYSAVELSLIAGGGGVNTYCSITYVISRKGGQRDGRYSGDFKRPPEGVVDGRDGGQIGMHGSGCMQDSGILHTADPGRRLREPSECRRLELRLVGGPRQRRLELAPEDLHCRGTYRIPLGRPDQLGSLEAGRYASSLIRTEHGKEVAA